MAKYRTFKRASYWYPDNWYFVIEKKTLGIWFEWGTFGKRKHFDDAVEQLKDQKNIVISKY